MVTPTIKLYPSAALQIAGFANVSHREHNDLEQRIEKNLYDVNSFINSCNDIKEMTTYIKDEKHKSKEM